MTNPVLIRPVQAGDKVLWQPLWQAYLDFYQQPLTDAVTQTTFARFLDPEEMMFMQVAIADDRMLGFATSLLHRSSWASVGYCYLEDLFVSENARGQGVARALIEAVATDATRLGAERLYWVTHDHNQAARTLYDRVASLTRFVQYQRAL